MIVPTEPVGSMPRRIRLTGPVATTDRIHRAVAPLGDEASQSTSAQFEATGSRVITDGEQWKYPRGS